MTSAVVRSVAADRIAISEPREWRADLLLRIGAGDRPVTLYGREAAGGVLVTAVLQSRAGGLGLTRTLVDAAAGYHALTAEVPAMHCFERELHEQHHVRLAGHPWLQPVRFERSTQPERDAYPFYAIAGKEVHEVAVGPIHAGVIEPGSFRFMCLGERVHHLEIHLGYQHRGVERLLLGRDPRALAPLVETIAGDTSVGHAWAYSAAMESLAGVASPAETEAARGVMLELERIAMHLSGLGGMAADVGFLQGASTYGRLRTTVINTSMRLSGSRFGRGAVRPGGLGCKLAADPGEGFSVAELRRSLALVKDDVALIDDCFLSARTVGHRLKGVGQLSREIAEELGLVGMAARACGISVDQRSAGGGVYRDHPVSVSVEPTGDCWARAVLRVREIARSLEWIEAVLGAFPRWEPSRSRIRALSPGQLVVAAVEGWRGEIVHCLETDAEGAVIHYKVQDPSLRNWLGLAIAVRENEISDFPICNKSFDLSYCGNDL